jgi:phosphocarrier protein FPr
MVSLVLVSHSKALALAVRALVQQVTGPDFPVAVASGVGEDHEEIGTDAVHIAEVLQAACGADGVLVLMDLGSAVLSAETALELLEDPACRERIRLCPAPLVEGALAAAVQAKAGSNLEEVYQEAQRALAPKALQIHPEPTTPISTIQPSEPGTAAELVFTVKNEHGLHARPAATLVQAVSKFSSEVQISNETAGHGPVPARSLTSLTLLQIRKGDRVKVVVRGADSEAVLHEIAALAKSGFREGIAQPAGAPIVSAPRAALMPESTGGVIRGTPAADGIAIGPLRTLQSSWEIPPDDSAGEPSVELAKLTKSMQAVRKQVSGAGTSAAIGDAAQVLTAQGLILDDPVLLEQLRSFIYAKKITAARAWVEVSQRLETAYAAMGDPYLRERAADVRDISRRVLQELTGRRQSALLQLDQPAILFVRELLPSEAAACDPRLVLGVIAGEGSSTSHSAILLRTLDIPMIVGVRGLDEAARQGQTAAMNGSTGEIWLAPGEAILRELREQKEQWLKRQRAMAAMNSVPSITLDGERIEILANAANASEAAMAARNGAEGIGLLRTEFLYPATAAAPTEEEQERALREVFAAIETGSVVVRTLDVGADKPLPFLVQAEERNPFLGVRGIRLALKHPEFFLSQLKAILTAAGQRDVWLMFPMISDAKELAEARALLEQAHAELTAAGKAHRWPIQAGIMVEVPSAAMLAEQLAAQADFFSIGTNDLTQYAMAAERGNPHLASLQDALHPGVLRMIAAVVESANAKGCHLSICGDAASDPLAAAVFCGLGIRSLSVRPNAVGQIKALFRPLRIVELRELANRAVACSDAAQVRALAEEVLSAYSREQELRA